jgi:hypothetical protein
MWRRYLAGSLILMVAATQSVWAESKKEVAENLKMEKNIMEAKAAAASHKNAFVVVDSRGGYAKGKIEGRLIETNEDGIVVADIQGRYGVPTIPVAYRDIKKIELGSPVSGSAASSVNAPLFKTKKPWVADAIAAGALAGGVTAFAVLCRKAGRC